MMPDPEYLEAARERFQQWSPLDRRIVAGEELIVAERPQSDQPKAPKALSYAASKSARERWEKAAAEDAGICRATGVSHRFHKNGYHHKTKAPTKKCYGCGTSSIVRPGDIVSGITY